MTVFADLLEHLPIPERRVEVHLDAEGAFPRVDLEPYPHGDRRGGRYPARPIRTLQLVLPSPHELTDFADHDAAARGRYLAARDWKRTDIAGMRVAFCGHREPRTALESVMTDIDRAVGVVSGSGTCVLGIQNGYRGLGTGRVFTLAVPQTVARRDLWLVPLAAETALRDAEIRDFEERGAFVPDEHELPDPPPVIEVRIGGQVHRVEVLSAAPGYWPMRAIETPDDRCALFERAWTEAFPGLGCPIGWLQLEMRQRDPDPRRVPDAPFLMTGEQSATFARLWRTVWPMPKALATFADQTGWQRALELAEALTVATADEWSGEVELLAHDVRDRWSENAEALIPVTAAAIYTAARDAGVQIERVPVCAAGGLLAGERYRDLPDGLPLDSRLALAWRGNTGGPRDLPIVRLRALHILSCPHPGAAPGGDRCVAVRERIEAGGRFDWSHITAGQITGLFEDGVQMARCERCGAYGPWLLARPAHTRWWAWALCRCGGATQIPVDRDADNAALDWVSATRRELEHHAHEHGFGMLIPWAAPRQPSMTDLTNEIGIALPSMVAGGDARWRAAVRAGARQVAAADPDHPAIPRSFDHAIIGHELHCAVVLAALSLYTLSEQTGLAPHEVDLRALLAAGAAPLHAHLSAALPGQADLDRYRLDWMWLARVGHWPGIGPADPATFASDPVPMAWATLTPGGESSSPSWAFRNAFRLLTALLDVEHRPGR